MRTILTSCAIALGALGACATGPDIQLVSTQKLTMPHEAVYGLEKWRHGHMITVDTGVTDSATFIIASPQDSDRVVFSFSPPHTARTWISDYDLDGRGAVVFCGQSYSSDGRLAPFIGVREPAAADIRVIRTYPYHPKVISAAPDGTIWTAGVESELVEGSPVVNQNGDVIRHFDRLGRLIGSAVPSGEIYPPRTVYGILVATSSRVGWYSPDGGKGTVYVEMSPDLRSSTRYPGMPDPHGYGKVMGFTLSENGDAYLTWEDRTGRATYRLDRTLKQWVKVAVPQLQKDSAPILNGEEEGVLVFRDGYDLNFVK